MKSNKLWSRSKTSSNNKKIKLMFSEKYFNNHKNISLISFAIIIISISILIHQIQAFSLSSIKVLGVGMYQPEIYLLPLIYFNLKCRSLKYLLIVNFLTGVLNFILVPFASIAINFGSIMLDYFVPALSMTVLWFNFAKRNVFIDMVLLFFVFFLIYFSHALSGYLFYSNGEDGNRPSDYHISAWTYTLVINFPYVFITYIISIFVWISQYGTRSKIIQYYKNKKRKKIENMISLKKIVR